MSIKDELRAELTSAIKEGDRARSNVIRQIETEVARERSAPGFSGEVDDDLYRTVMASYAKRMEKARLEFAAAGERGDAHVAALTFEIDYVSRWLPQVLGDEETRAAVDAAIAELGADDPKHAGRVIGHVMKSGQSLDGALVNRLVRERLGG